MSNATYTSKDNNISDETTVYWFDVDGENFGVSDCNGERKIIDCDGCPVDVLDARYLDLPEILVVTEEMEQDY